MKKNNITNKITPCCGLPFPVIYWWISNLTLNSESDRQFILSKISQNGTISIDGWKVLINSGTLEADASLTKAEFLAWFNCERLPSCEQLKLLIENFKIGNWTPEIDGAIIELIDEKFLEIGQNFNLGVINLTTVKPTEGKYLGQVFVAGNYTNFGQTVTQAELDENFVFFYVNDGVVSKQLSKKPLTGGTAENKIKRNIEIEKEYTILKNTRVNSSGLVQTSTGAETFKIAIPKGLYKITVETRDTVLYFMAVKSSDTNTFLGFATTDAGVQSNALSEIYLMHNDESTNNYDKWLQQVYVTDDNAFLYVTKTNGAFSRTIDSIHILPLIPYENPFINTNIVCSGDSVTDGRNGGYLFRLKRNLGCNIIKSAKSGGTSATLVSLLTNMTRTADTAKNLDYSNVSAVTIMIGTNAGVSGSISDIPTTNISNYANESDYWDLFKNSYYGNLGLCIEYIKNKNPKTRIFLITPIILNIALIEPIRSAMILLKNYYNIELIDVWENGGIFEKNINLFMADSLHPNFSGNRIIGEYVSNYIANAAKY